MAEAPAEEEGVEQPQQQGRGAPVVSKEEAVTFISPAQYYHQRDVKHRLKEQEELRHRSGPEAPHSHHLAAEAARQNGLGQVDVEEGQRSPRWHLSGGWTNKVVASMHREEPEEELGGERS